MDGSGAHSGSTVPLRAGGAALALLGSPFNVEALRSLAAEALPLRELMRTLGFPPRSTARLYLRTLSEMNTLERRARSEFPASVDYEITAAGRALLGVADALQTWLDGSPAGPTELGSTGARSVVKALVDGWASNIVRAVATRPLSLTELDSLIPRISYPSLERRLTALRQVGLVEAHRLSGRTSPYQVTGWLRQSVPALIAAVDWERRYAAASTPEPRRLDIEAAFLLAVPLVELPRGTSGKCRLAVEVNDSTGTVLAGVAVAIEDGIVTACVPSLGSEADAWASGSPLAWLDELSGRAVGELEIGGKGRVAEALTDALRGTAVKPA